jgi:hypothetical protein
MGAVRTVPFNDLPHRTRERFVNSVAGTVLNQGTKPLLAQREGSFSGGWLILSAAAGYYIWSRVRRGYGEPYFSDAIQPAWALLIYGVLIGLLVLAALTWVQRRRAAAARPYPAGRYLFPLDLVVAEEDQLRIYGLASLEGIDSLHHHTNGVYTHTEMTFRFPEGEKVSFTVKGREVAESVVQRLKEGMQRAQQALQQKDLAALSALDPFFECELNGWQLAPGDSAGPRFVPVPAWLTFKGRARIAGLAALVLAPPLWHVRNVLSDHAMFARAVAVDRSAIYAAYLSHGTRHAEEARQRHFTALFREAQQKGTVTAYREMIKAHPKSPYVGQARDAIHALYTRAWERFRARAGDRDPGMLAFMQLLLRHQEEHDSPQVEVFFRSPDNRVLASLDRVLQSKNVAPVAPHFSLAAAGRREGMIAAVLKRGFAGIFPADTLHIEARPRASGTVPSIEIRYGVNPTSMIYSSQRSQRAFIGIRIDFQMTLRIPGHAETFPIVLSVAPPERFSVQFTSRRAQPLPGEGPSDSQVYSVMAERAFDEFAGKLNAVFFGAPVREAPQAVKEPEAPPQPAVRPPVRHPAKRRHR